MLAEVTVNNQEVTVYTVPQGKKAFLYIDIYSQAGDNVTIKINDKVFYSDSVVDFLSFKLSLSALDTVKVASNGSVNVFIHGLEV